MGSTPWISQNKPSKSIMSCPQTMILQSSIQQPTEAEGLEQRSSNHPDSTPATGLKQQTLCIKNTQQDLTGWKLSFPTLKDMQAINNRFLSNSTKEGGVLCQTLSSYSLLVSESLLPIY